MGQREFNPHDLRPAALQAARLCHPRHDAQTTKTNSPVDRKKKNGDFKKGGEEGQGASRAPDCRQGCRSEELMRWSGHE